MKKRLTKFFVGALAFCVLLTSCETIKSVLNQAASLANLVNCTYALKDVQNVYVAGVNVKNVANGQITAADVLKLSSALLAKKVPLSMDVNVNVTNPTATAAALSAMDWILQIDGTQFANGSSTKPVSITPNATTAVAIPVSADIYSMFSQSGLDALKNFVNSFSGDGTSSKVAIKIKPSLDVNGVQVPMPDYINLQKTTGGSTTPKTGSTSTTPKSGSTNSSKK